MALRINHLHIKTSDVERTAKWFVDNLGATIVGQYQGETIGYRVDLHGLRVNVTGFVKGQQLEQHYGMEHLALDTDELAATVEKLKASGTRILHLGKLPNGRNVCFLEGPEGVCLELMEQRKD